MVRRVSVCLALIFCGVLWAAEKPKNIILMVGDGMGPAHIKAYRIFKDNSSTHPIENTVFDSILLGSLATDPAPWKASKDKTTVSPNVSEGGVQVTDSAASATAYSAGHKTYNGAIAVDVRQKKLTTVLEVAKSKGMRTGLVATSQIVHATPAAFIAHVNSRKSYNQIADYFVDNQYGSKPVIDVFLGGGWKYFKREDRDLVTELKAFGFDIARNKKELTSSGNKVAGLFADDALPAVLEREASQPDLAEMTAAAVQRLNNDNGFFLMVEGSQIDWASHDNDINGTVHEMDEFAKAVEVALQFAQKDKNTLVLVTADHETGGLSIGGRFENDDRYAFNTSVLRKMKKPLYRYAEQLVEGAELKELLKPLGVVLTPSEEGAWLRVDKKNGEKVYAFLKRVINRVTHSGWTTHGHTGVDVYIYGMGPGSAMFRGHHHNTFVGQQIRDWLTSKTGE
ncbi:alkaline phosphatase [Pleionea sp. CnH1-48]|uniref:alkaline phosphatase n=1 Tax=Pleionea sp. CnH1-48 TaxID=2954494 RepID=UPI002096A501|nr:alkaline phosphatase [Pleionea sp. CnH1-48]MCO7224523.1 alkaline phosphatase [Pleionea sp. CnH1-48]